MPRKNIDVQIDLDSFYTNPEFGKTADSLLGKVTEHQTEVGRDYSKEAILEIAIQILKDRIGKRG